MISTSQVCKFCVMDGSNPHIEWDENGVCNCCRDARRRLPYEWFPDHAGRERLDQLVYRLKEQGKDKPYDALIGLSGGVDSAYLAHKLRADYDLRLLAVHVDGGWNTEAAVRNIELIVRKLDIDLHTYVVEWEEMRDLQLAFLKASVLNQDMPQDHAFFSTLYRTSVKFGIRTFLSGVNFSGENISLPHFGYPAMDGRNLRAIHAHYGTRKLKTYPVMSPAEYIWLTKLKRQLTILKPLDYLPFDKEKAKQELIDVYGYKDYGGKHHESRFTKFYQEVYLPARYNFDKRRLHLSCRIVSGQITRDEALNELATPICNDRQAKREVKFIAKKLQISVDELWDIIHTKPVPHVAFANSLKLYNFGSLLKRLRQKG